MLQLQEHDAAPYREIILDNCLYNSRNVYDPQINGDRADYLYEIIHLTHDVRYFRDQILAALPTAEDGDDRQLLYDLACRFAEQEDDEARRVMYETFARQDYERPWADGNGRTIIITEGMEALIRLDGFQAFLFIAERLGAIAAQGIDVWIVDEPYRLIREQMPEDEFTAAFTQAAAQSAIVDRYKTSLEERLAYSERIARAREREQNKASSLTELETLIEQERGTRRVGVFQRWARHASRDDLVRAAEMLIAEGDSQRQIALAKLFRDHPFPVDPTALIAMADSDDVDTIRAGANALAHTKHPAVRDLALRLLVRPNWEYQAIDLLIENYEDGDEQIIARTLQAVQSEDEAFHGVGLAALHVFEKHPKPENVPMLALLYEREPCGNCRNRCVEQLIAHSAFADWMIQECAHDSNRETRERTLKYVAAHSGQ